MMQVSFNLSRNKVYALILTLSILVSLFIGIQVGTATTANAPWTLNAPPTSAYNAYVGQYANGTYYYEKSDWQTWYNSANASQVINFAIGNLTVGRTWKETVYLQGNFTVDSSIVYANYTTILLNGKITLANNIDNADIFYASSKTNIELIGGEIDGNDAGQSANYRSTGIELIDCSNVLIDNVNIHNIKQANNNAAEGFGIHTSGTSFNIKINNCYIYDIGTWGLELGNGNAIFFTGSTTNSSVTNNHIKHVEGGILIYGYSSQCLIDGNYVEDTERDAVSLYPEDGAVYDNIVSNNHFINWGADNNHNAVKLGYTSGICRGNIINGNFFSQPTGTYTYSMAIVIYASSSFNTISNNIFRDIYPEFIEISSGASGNMIIGNMFDTCRRSARSAILVDSGALNSTILDNFFNGITSATVISDLGTGSIIHNNVLDEAGWTP